MQHNKNYKNQIKEYVKTFGGIVTSKYCREHNIPTIYLNRLVEEGFLFNAKRGIYLTKDGDYDEFYFFQLRYPKAIYSYNTALYFIDRTDKLSHTIDITVYNGYKFNEKMKNVDVHYVDKRIYDIGIVEVETAYGNKVKAYSLERVLCDFLVHKNEIDSEDYLKLVQSYIYDKNKDVSSFYNLIIKMGVAEKIMDVVQIMCE